MLRGGRHMSELFRRELKVTDTRDTQKVLREIIEHIQSMQMDLEKEYRQRKEREKNGGV